MQPAATPGGLRRVAAIVLTKALQWAMKRNQPTISESELVQHTKNTIFGSKNQITNIISQHTTNVVSSSSPSSSPSPQVSESDIHRIVQQCFALVVENPGFGIRLTLYPDNTKVIEILNLTAFSPPTSEEYFARPPRRIEGSRTTTESSRFVPFELPSELDRSTDGIELMKYLDSLGENDR